MTDRQWIFDQLREALVRLFETDPALVTPQARLREDLDIDSIDAVDLVLELGRQTDRRIDPALFRSARTVEDVLGIVQRALDASTPAPTDAS